MNEALIKYKDEVAQIHSQFHTYLSQEHTGQTVIGSLFRFSGMVKVSIIACSDQATDKR